MSTLKIDQIKIEIARSTEDACKAIACAAELATKALASAAIEAKNVIAADAAKAVKVEEKRANGTHFMDVVYKQVSLYLTLGTILIGSFIYLTNPSKDNDTALQLQDARITSQRETIDTLTKTSQNDTVEVKEAVKDLATRVGTLNTEVATLTAIINERIPAKK